MSWKCCYKPFIIYFLDPVRLNFREIILFHDLGCLLVVPICVLVMGILYIIIARSFRTSKLIHNETLEAIWTIRPSLVLIFLAVPSLKLLYDSATREFPEITFNVVASQWYWSYDENSVGIKSSYLLRDTLPRNLGGDMAPGIVAMSEFGVISSSSDVLHSYAIPSLGIKQDCVPGRLNGGVYRSEVVGYNYGQCSELCGVNHSFMPCFLISA